MCPIYGHMRGNVTYKGLGIHVRPYKGLGTHIKNQVAIADLLNHLLNPLLNHLLDHLPIVPNKALSLSLSLSLSTKKPGAHSRFTQPSM